MKPVPPHRRAAVPYLIVKGAQAAIQFYKNAFGATEQVRLDQPDGRIGHAELSIDEAQFMLADEFSELVSRGPQPLSSSPVAIHVYVEDVDALVKRAQAVGATVPRPPEDQFFGDRTAEVRDPFGHRWFFATVLEEIGYEEMKRRAQQ